MRTAIIAAAAAAAFRCLAMEPGEVTKERFPDADAVALEEIETTTYKPDGTYVTVSESRVKILTEKGRREEGVISLSYSKRYGSACIEDVRILGEDGEERIVDFAATTSESTDNSSVSENIYDPLQLKIVCTIPGLKVGDTVSYRVRRTAEKPRVKNLFGDVSAMEWTVPILSQTYRVHAPAELPLKKMDVRNPLGNLAYSCKKLEDGSMVHEWKSTKESPQMFPEPDMPPVYTQVQRVLVSTAESWEEISRWYWDLSKDHLAKTTSAITNMVAAIDPGEEAGIEARCAAIYKWVSQEIRYMGLTMEDTSPGYAPHDVDITFDNRYGVCRDKAALLVAMLRIAGIEAYPVLIHAGAKMDEQVPLPFFNHAIVAARAPGDKAANKDGFILMDPTNESSADLFPAYLGDRSYLVAAPWGEPLHVSQVPGTADNALVARSSGTLERDGSLVMNTTIELNGINDNAYRQALLGRKNEERRRIAEGMAKSIAPGAELISFEIEPRDLRDTETLMKIKLFYRVDGAMLKGETRDELSLPLFSRSQGAVNWVLAGNTALEKRRYPLVIDSTGLSEDFVEIDLGKWSEAEVALPERVSIDGAYSYLREYSVKDGRLCAHRRLAVDKVEFSPADYAAMREARKTAEKADRPRPLFAKNAAADASVRFLRSHRTYNVASPYCWTSTNTVRKQVLNYNGKKTSAELTLSYNPTWKNIEVVSATVTNPDGKTSAVSEHEKTLLDCNWAAAAPCYPASKQLVVTLPSVEIGSIIEYTIASTVSNSPAPFYATWSFDSVEPADEISIDYRDWRGETFSRTVKNARRVAAEQMQPPSELWRDMKTMSLGDFGAAAERLRKAADVKALAKDKMPVEVEDGAGVEEKIRAIRDWMVKHVRIAGPSLYELPLEQQLSDPEDVLERRYATRLDYIRTMCAAMKGAGLDADIVFSSDDALFLPEIVRNEIEEYPLVTRYRAALCRVRERKGGFLWWGGETKDIFVGLENEYTPVGESAYARARYLDPATGNIHSLVATPEQPANETEITLGVDESGNVAARYLAKSYGISVGAFRKGYAEMLPEDRSRHYMGLLNALSQGAVPASPLQTDITGYPAKLSFAAILPGFATVAEDSVSVTLPGIGGQLFRLSGSSRETPIYVPGGDVGNMITVKTVFPEGYGKIEHLPADVVLKLPGSDESWYELRYSTSKDGRGRTVVTAVERIMPHAPSMLGAEYFALLKDWSRIVSSREKRTISIRKGE